MAGTPEQVYFQFNLGLKRFPKENLNEWLSAYTIDTTKSKNIVFNFSWQHSLLAFMTLRF
jgi:hypothetical protein